MQPEPRKRDHADGPLAAFNAVLDRIRLASTIALIGAVGGLYALISGQIDYVEFGVGLGALQAGAGLLGTARNGAGHGTGPAEHGTGPVET